MHIILVYDVSEERVGKVCRFMKRYLPRVQNSVFEGDLSLSKLEAMKVGLNKILDANADSVLIWVFQDTRWVERQKLGFEKLPITNFL